MFKKLIYMTALSLALASPPEAYCAENYTLSDSVSIDVSDKSIFNNTNFTTNTINSTASHNSTAHSSSVFTEAVFGISLSSAISSNAYMAVRPIMLEYCDCNCIQYAKIESKQTIRNKIMGNCWEKFISNNWLVLGVNAFTILFFIKGFTGHALSLIPPAILGFARFLTDSGYIIKCLCSSNSELLLQNRLELEEDVRANIEYSKKLYEHGCCQCFIDLLRCITKSSKESEKKRVIDFVIKHGGICELVEEVGFNVLVDAINANLITKEHITELVNKHIVTINQLKDDPRICIDKLKKAGLDFCFNKNNDIRTDNSRHDNSSNVIISDNDNIINVNNNVRSFNRTITNKKGETDVKRSSFNIINKN